MKFPRDDVPLYYIPVLDGRPVRIGPEGVANGEAPRGTQAVLTGFKQWAWGGHGHVSEARDAAGKTYWSNNWVPVGWEWTPELRIAVALAMRATDDVREHVVMEAIRTDKAPPDDRVAAIKKERDGLRLYEIGNYSTFVSGPYKSVKAAQARADKELSDRPSWADQFSWEWRRVTPNPPQAPPREPEPPPPGPKVVDWSRVPSVGLIMHDWPGLQVAETVAEAIGGQVIQAAFYQQYDVKGPLPPPPFPGELEMAAQYLAAQVTPDDLVTARDEFGKRSQELWALGDERPLWDGEHVDSKVSHPPPIEVIEFDRLSDEADKRRLQLLREMLPPERGDTYFTHRWLLGGGSSQNIDMSWRLAHNLLADKKLRREWESEGLGWFEDEASAFWQAAGLLMDPGRMGTYRGRLQTHLRLLGQEFDTDYVRPEEAQDLLKFLERSSLAQLPDSILARYFNRVEHSFQNPWPGAYGAQVHNQLEFYRSELCNEIGQRIRSYVDRLGVLRNPKELKPGDIISDDELTANDTMRALLADLTPAAKRYFVRKPTAEVELIPETASHWSKPFSSRPWMR